MPTGTLHQYNPPWSSQDIDNDEHAGTPGARKVVIVDPSGTSYGSGTNGFKVQVVGTNGSNLALGTAGVKTIIVDSTGGTHVTGTGGVRTFLVDSSAGGTIGPTNGLHGAPVNIQTVSILVSASRTAGSIGTSGSGLGLLANLAPFTNATFLVRVVGGTGTLNLAIQRLLPDGTLWDTVIRFPQHATASGTFSYVADINAAAGNTPRAIDSTTDITAAALAAGDARDVAWGSSLRVVWSLAGTSTFDVLGNFRV